MSHLHCIAVAVSKPWPFLQRTQHLTAVNTKPLLQRTYYLAVNNARHFATKQTTIYDEPTLNVDDIQGDPLSGFKKPHLAILAIDLVKDDNTNSAAKTKQWLTDYVIPKVTSAKDVILFRNMFRKERQYRGGIKPTTLIQTCTNVSFSYNALMKLAPKHQVEKFYKPGMNVAFKIGLKNRSAFLSDPTSGKTKNRLEEIVYTNKRGSGCITLVSLKETKLQNLVASFVSRSPIQIRATPLHHSHAQNNVCKIYQIIYDK